MIRRSSALNTMSLVQTVPADPGRIWIKDREIALDAPPDRIPLPAPDAVWSRQEKRTGIAGVVSPRAICLGSGGYRLFYTQLLARPGFPAGANDYDHCTARILSAYSPDGESWTPEPGIRLSPSTVGPETIRVVSSEVVPLGHDGQLRMYFEASSGPQTLSNSLHSASSDDEGLNWTLEPGPRLQQAGHYFSTPRVVLLDGNRVRLYCYERGQGIISALSDESGLVFQREPGVRIPQDGPWDACVAFAPEILRLQCDGTYVMYYAGYQTPAYAVILRAVSSDGLQWKKEPDPVIIPSPAAIDAAKCSEMCLIPLPSPADATPRYRMLYEACDGTSTDQRGVWRIATATSG